MLPGMQCSFSLVALGAGAVLTLGACGSKAKTPSSQMSSSEGSLQAGAPESTVTEEPQGRAAEASPPTTSVAAKPGASSGSSKASAGQRWVDAHNVHRAKHCAPPLTWSPELAAVAQTWADTLAAKGCMFGHSTGSTYGENLAAGTSGALDPESTVGMWYDEVAKYSFTNGGFSMETGHFTQVVWTTTKRVGCGQVTCKGNDIIVCNYDPPGNWEGQYKQHVLSTSCKK